MLAEEAAHTDRYFASMGGALVTPSTCERTTLPQLGFHFLDIIRRIEGADIRTGDDIEAAVETRNTCGAADNGSTASSARFAG